MKWIIATSTLLILSQPALSQQSRPCEQGDIGQTGITRCRTPDVTGATIDRSGTIDSGPTNPGAANPGSGGPVVVPNDPLATGLNPNPLVGSPGMTGLGTAGPQAQIPSRVPPPATVTPRIGNGRSTTGVGSAGTTTRTSPGTPMGSGRTVGKGAAGMAGKSSVPGSKKSGRKMVGAGNSVTKGTSSMPGASMGSGGKAVGGASHRIRPMGGSRSIRSHSRR